MICEIIVTAKLSGVQCINPLNAHKVVARRKRYRKMKCLLDGQRWDFEYQVRQPLPVVCLVWYIVCFLCIIRRVLFKLQLETGHIINSWTVVVIIYKSGAVHVLVQFRSSLRDHTAYSGYLSSFWYGCVYVTGTRVCSPRSSRCRHFLRNLCLTLTKPLLL